MADFRTSIALCNLDRVHTGALSTTDISNRFPPPALPAFIESVLPEPYALFANATLSIRTGHAVTPVTETATVLATPASVTNSTNGPFAISGGDDLTVTINGIPLSVTFASAGSLSARDVADQINATLTTALATVSDNGLRITLDTVRAGTSAALQVTGGAANAALNFSTAPKSGTGNVADVSAVNLAELHTIISGLTHVASRLSSENEKINIESTNETLEVLEGSVQTALGFTTTIRYPEYYYAEKDASLYVDIFELGASALSYCKVDVKTNDAWTTLYIGPTGHPSHYINPLWFLLESYEMSPGAVLNDVWRIRLTPSSSFSFVSEETVTFRVQAVGSADVTATSYFKIIDYSRPEISSVTVLSPTQMRVLFSEDMNTEGAGFDSILTIREVSGRMRFHTQLTIGSEACTNVIEAPMANFDASHVGLFLGVFNAREASNNGYFLIQDVKSPSHVTVDRLLSNEDITLDGRYSPRAFLSPYRLRRVVQDAATPSFVPIITSVNLVSLVLGEIPAINFADFNLHDNLTFSAPYILDAVAVTDLSGNEITGSFEFTSIVSCFPVNREWDLWTTCIPGKNKYEDYAQDLERFVRCIQEVAEVLLKDVDDFGWLFDPSSVKANCLLPLVYHLGNPYSFVAQLSTQQLRDLVQVLVSIYRRKGTAIGIRDTVEFFLNKDVQVVPWVAPEDTWSLGDSELGFTTYLGPSNRHYRYAFSIYHLEDLTDQDKAIISEIVKLSKPAHTHFISFVYGSFS